MPAATGPMVLGNIGVLTVTTAGLYAVTTDDAVTVAVDVSEYSAITAGNAVAGEVSSVK